MSAAARAAVIRFRGAPDGLTAVVPGTAFGRRGLLRVGPARKGQEATEFTVHATALEGVTHLQLALPTTTPAGKVEAKLVLADGEIDAILEIDPLTDVDVFPDTLRLSGKPKDRVSVEITVVNRGNVDAEVRGAYVFGLFAVDGAERAVHRALSAKSVEGRGRVDTLADSLAEEHGGIVRVKVEEGAGPLGPGEARAVRAQLTLPESLRPGRTYSGTWPIEDARYYVRLQVTEEVVK